MADTNQAADKPDIAYILADDQAKIQLGLRFCRMECETKSD